MCMGMMNYRKPKEELTVISCKKCGKSWQVTETAAKYFNVLNEAICVDCSKSSKEKVSLLKRKTNFDNLKDLSAWDFAGKIDEFVGGDCDICPFSRMEGDVQECLLLDYKPSTCRQKYTQWLESEVDNATD